MKRSIAIWAFLITGLLLAIPYQPYAQTIIKKVSTSVTEVQIRSYEKQLVDVEKDYQYLARQRRRLIARLDELGRDIQKLKSQKERNFFEKRQLQKLLANQLEVSKEAQQLDTRIKNNRNQKENLRTQLRFAYELKLKHIVRRMDQEEDRGKALELSKEFSNLREKARLYDKTPKSEPGIGAFFIKLEPLDGVREINEKIDLLNDRMKNLQSIIEQIDKEINRLKNERKLAREMQQILEERNLFEDGVLFAPSPRTLPIPKNEDGGSGSDATDSSSDKAGVHTSPAGGVSASGKAMMFDAIDKEIARLEKEKEYLNKVIAELMKKVDQFRQKIKDISFIFEQKNKWTFRGSLISKEEA